MELRQANNFIKNALSMLSSSGYKISAKAQTDAALRLFSGKDFPDTDGSKTEGNRLFFRVLQSMREGMENFTPAALIKLHAQLFGKNSEAGKLRSVPASLEGSSFTDSSFIGGSLKRLLLKMSELTGSPDSSKEDFALALTHYFSELFLLCPFKYGSLLTLCLFFWHFAQSKGFYINYHKNSRSFYEAVKTAFLTDEVANLYVCFTDAVSYFTPDEPPAKESEEIKTVKATVVKRELKRDAVREIKVKTAKKMKAKKAEPATPRPAPVKPNKSTKKEGAVNVKKNVKTVSAASKTTAKTNKKSAANARTHISLSSQKSPSAAQETAAALSPKSSQKNTNTTAETETFGDAKQRKSLTANTAPQAAKTPVPADGSSSAGNGAPLTAGKEPLIRHETAANDEQTAQANKTDGTTSAQSAAQSGGSFPKEEQTANGKQTNDTLPAAAPSDIVAAKANVFAVAVPKTTQASNEAQSQPTTKIDFIDMPSSVLKKAAKIKQKIETLQTQLSALIEPYRKRD